ncbi:MAG: tryptophan--tRNA ligase [Candidatus Hydrogenedentes bacterium]|nr:tryptophan--tRNA ligase [Candidatus Hydrogenedentota bacterium]
MSAKQEVILSGIRPTGRLHYGNYFGAVQHFLRLQDAPATCYYFIADYHALTTIAGRRDIRAQTIDMLRTYIACGLDPARSIVYRQSDLPCTAELALLLGMITNIGHLERGTTYKDKFIKLKEDPKSEGNPLSYGLLGYPVLMAADILIVKADLVPVGDDQRQHVEMACDIAEKFNSRFGAEVLHIPRAVDRSALRLPGLDGSQKMGKSDNNTLDLLDDAATVLKKMKGVPTTTDPAPLDTDSTDPDVVIPKMPAGVGVLYRLLSLVAPQEVYLDYIRQYRDGGKFYGTLKKSLAEYCTAFNAPIIEKFNDPQYSDDFIEDFLRENAKRVTPVALDTVESCREAMGIGRSLYRG